MEEEMEDSVMYTFTAFEIDLDYEFDAARFFDFCREESLEETLEAEFWFQSRGSYPPSPFVKKLVLREDIRPENVTTSSKTGCIEDAASTESDPDFGVDMDISEVDTSHRECESINARNLVQLTSCNLPLSNQCHNVPPGLTFSTSTINIEARRTAYINKSVPRVSTLMKPTASQLAKQKKPNKMGDLRFLKSENYNSSVANSSALESQPAKRQKLEGGHSHKVADTNQQTHLVHKEPKADRKADGNLAHAKLRLTIPKEPAFETAHRAHRTKPKIREHEQLAFTAPTFRARPLNRKMLEAPSMLLPKRSIVRMPEFQEFHLKTSERAMQHNNPSSSALCSIPKGLHQPRAGSTAECSNKDPRKTYVLNPPKQQGSEVVHKFKALPLNKKIFSSNGDIGVSRNNKKETTVPIEFSFHTERRVQHDPPVELFNMLTLTAELRPSTGPHINLPSSACTFPKGAKKNTLGSFQQETEVQKTAQEKTPRFKLKQIPAHTITKIGVSS